jgi:Holliday junction resolvase RusA-like endonuclease
MSEPIVLEIVGDAAPAGSKTAGKGKGGFAFVRDACKRTGPWKEHVARTAAAQYSGPLLSGPLKVTMTFSRIRPTSHYGSGRNADKIKDSSPVFPVAKPDITKLVRAVEDALKGVIYPDDSLIVENANRKLYAPKGQRPGVKVIVSEMVFE